MKTHKFYAVTYNTDMTEGRGTDVPVAHFHTLAEAERAASDKDLVARHGVWGTGPLGIREISIYSYDTLEEYKERASLNLKERALAKLTPQERKALGL